MSSPTRSALLMSLVVSLAAGCQGTGEEPGRSSQPLSGVHRVQASGAAAERLLSRGGKLIADYGAYALLDVDGQKLGGMPAGAFMLRDEYRNVMLNAGTIDALDPSSEQLRETVLPGEGKRLHLVQFAGTVKAEWYAALEGTGVKVVGYIPHNAYLVWGDKGALGKLVAYGKAGGEVQWDGPYLDDYKLNPRVYVAVKPDGWQVQLVEDGEANAETVAKAAAMEQGGKLNEDHSLGYVNLVVHAEREAVLGLARQPDVVSIIPYYLPVKLDERANVIAGGQLTGNGPSGPGWLAFLAAHGFTQAQFDASGFGVDVSDSGLDNATLLPNHYALYRGGDRTSTSRVAYARLEGTPNSGIIQGCDGHGNLNAHIIMGYSNLSAAPHQDAAGYKYNLGIAPYVKVGSSVVFDPNTFTSPDYEDLQSRAYRDGMRISSNSWGAAVGGTYTSTSQRYDALVRDAQPASAAVPVAGNQEMVIVFAAGNSGSGANTVGSPATAKNLITAGAAENVHPFGAADQCGITDAQADSANDIIFFSSRGPTDDGRIKPDLVAAGTHVSGGVGQNVPGDGSGTGTALTCFDATGVCAGPGTSNFWPVGQQWSTASSGTSHSTPLIAGAAALVRQHVINTTGSAPGSAMVKALLMNGARYMTGVSANDNLYSNNQGMGHLDLGMTLDSTARLMRDEVAADLFTATGQTRTFNIFISDPAKPFRVTLAWTDAPGSTTGSSYNNDLDLTVAVGANTYLGNVFTGRSSVTGGVADIRNNVESVFLPAGVTGLATVTVTATNINSDGVPGNASPLDQDFALVVYNVCDTQPDAPTGATASVPGLNQIQVDWTAPAVGNVQEYHIYRGTAAGGPYTQVGIAPAAATTYTDSTVSGGTTYYYVVRAVDCAESVDSNEVSALATGDCRLLPVFAGLTSATNAGAATCGVDLAWSAATPSCAGPITYTVYRSRTAGFTPGTATRIATGVTGTTFSDAANLIFPNRYYYVVRAVESAGSSLNEDTNTIESSAQPTGAVTPAIGYFDDLDGTRPANADAYWQTAGAGAANIQKSICHFQSTTTAWRFGGTVGNTCPSAYANNLTPTLTLGGDGSVAGINGFVFPAAGAGSLSFRHAWNMESGFDGVILEYSTTGAAGTYTKVGTTATPTEPYITAGGYNGSIGALGGACWSSTQALTNGSFLTTTVNVDALFGQTAWFRWSYRTDSSVVREGHYLDDVNLTVDAFGSCTTGTVPPGPAATYSVTLPATSAAGTAVTADIQAFDSMEQVAIGYSGTANLSTSDAQATIPATVSFASGVASASVTFGTVGPQTLTAADATDATITGEGGTVVTPGAPVALRFSVQPSDATAGVNISPAIRVQVVDVFGNLVTSATDSIDMAIGANPGGGTLNGTTTVSAVGGTAVFSDLNIQQAGVGYTLTASSGTLTSATSAAFDITADVAASMRFGQQPTSSVAGVPFSPAVAVEILDQYGNPATGTPTGVLVAIENNAGGGVLLGTAFVTSAGGVAAFPDIAVTKVGTGYTLSATSSLSTIISGAFDITPNVPHHLVVTQEPADTAVNTPISSVVVEVRDFYDNLATQSFAPVSAALVGGTPGARLLGSTTVFASAGVASFDDLAVDRSGQAYTLFLASTGLYGDSTIGFDVAPGPAPVGLEFVSQPGNSAAGVAISPAVTVRVVDASGNTVLDASGPVTLALGANPGGGTLSGSLTASPAGGVATFSGLSIDRAGTGYTLAASSSGLTSATSSAFDVSAAAASRLVFGVQPSNAAAGQAIAPAVTVEARDAFGNLDAAFTGSVTVALGGGNSNATLSGTATASATAGVATFSDLSVNKTGRGYTLAASASGASSATSNTFNIGSGPPSKYVLGGLGASVTSSVQVSFSIQALDAQDNLAIDYAGTASITSNDAAAILPASVTFASGVASNVLVTFKTPGVHRLTATDTSTASLTASASLVVTNFPQPTVSITEPTNGSSVTGTVTVSAQGAVATGTTLTKLEIFVDGVSLTSGASSPQSANWEAGQLKGGTTHLIHAVVTDGAGNVVQSTPLTVVIGQQGCGCTTGTGGADMALLAAVGAALRAIAIRRRRVK